MPFLSKLKNKFFLLNAAFVAIILLLFFADISFFVTTYVLFVYLSILFLKELRWYFTLGFISLIITVIAYASGGNDIANFAGYLSIFLYSVGAILYIIRSYIPQPCYDLKKVLIGRRQTSIIIIIIALTSVILCQAIIMNPGVMLSGDFTLPFSDEAYSLSRLSELWNQYGSYNELGSLPGRPWLIIMAFLSFFSSEWLTKLMVLLPVFGGMVGSFFFFRYFLERINFSANNTSYLICIAALGGAMFYIVNPWSLGLIGHYFHWLAYCFLPLAVFFWQKTLVLPWRRAWPFLLGLAITSGLTMASPHFFVYAGIIYFLLFATHFLKIIWCKKYLLLIPIFLKVLLAILLILSVSLPWFLPTVLENDTSSLNPAHYIVNIDDVIAANKDYSLLITISFSLKQGFLPVLLTLFLLVFLLLITIRSKKRQFLFFLWSVLGLSLSIPILYFFFTNIYTGLLFNLPFGWLIRSPLRISSLAALPLICSLSAVLFLGLKELITNDKAKYSIRKKLALAFVITIGTIILFSGMRETFFSKYVPQQIPTDYSVINERISIATEGKSTWWPSQYDARKLEWLSEKSENFANSSSAKPSLGSQNLFSRAFLRYLSSRQYQAASFSEYLYLLGSKFLVLRKDLDPEIANKIDLSQDQNLEMISEDEFLDLYENSHYSKQFTTKSCLVAINGGMNSFEHLMHTDSLVPERCAYVFLDQINDPELFRQIISASDLLVNNDQLETQLKFKLLDTNNFIYPFNYSRFSDSGKQWARASTYDPLHGEWHQILQKRNMDNWQFDSGHGLVYARERKKTESMPQRLVLPIERPPGKYKLFARVFKSWSGGTIRLTLDQEEYFDISLNSPNNTFSWIQVADIDITDNQNIQLESLDGFNAVESLVLITDEEMQSAKAELSQIIKRVPRSFLHQLSPAEYLFNNLPQNETGNQITILEFDQKTSSLQNKPLKEGDLKFLSETEAKSMGEYSSAISRSDYFDVLPNTEYVLVTRLTTQNADNLDCFIDEFTEKGSSRSISHGIFTNVKGDIKSNLFYRIFKTKDSTNFIRLRFSDVAEDVYWTTDKSLLLKTADLERQGRPISVLYMPSNLKTVAEKDKVVVFNESFDPNWRANYSSVHIPAYGFLNGFLLPENIQPGTNYEIGIEYSGAKYYKLGLIIMFICLTFYSLMLVFIFLKKQKPNATTS